MSGPLTYNWGMTTDEMPDHDGAGLSDAQLDGHACIRCGRLLPPTAAPIAFGPRGQLFACAPRCDDEDRGDPRSTLPLSPARRDAQRELHEQRMIELQQLAKQISDLELQLGVKRGQLDSRLYYLHEDGVAIAELARNARRSRETVYASIDRYRAENHPPAPAA